MPFMKGVSPVRRTLKYLKAGNLMLKSRVRIVSVNYNPCGEHHRGARDFVFWNVPQIQYNNPDVQFVLFKNLTPTPFVRCFLDDGEEVLMDVDGKDRHEIESFLKKILGKTEKTLAQERLEKEEVKNPANFGWDYKRHCICEVPGQAPCPSVIPYPNHMRGKYKYGRDLPSE